MKTISVIIPALNEERGIGKTVLRVKEEGPHEVIVVDGGSADRTVACARKAGATVLSASPCWRSSLMNVGAKAATGEYLLFLHADTIIPCGAFSFIPDGADAATFHVKWDTNHPWLRVVAWFKNHHDIMLNCVLGDHGLIARRSIFEEMGGFADIPIMEDLEFYRRLAKRTRIHVIKRPVVTSARRFIKNGMLRQWCVNQIIKSGYALGVPHEKLARLYYGLRKD